MYISTERICGLYRAGEPPTHAAVESETETLSLRECAPELARCLRFVRVATGRAALQTGLAMALPVLFCWLAITMPLDWMVELPRWARALFLVAGMGGAAWVGWHFGLREWLHRPSDEAVALRIEKALPEFRSRFIASVQLSREGDGALVRALLAETTNLARSSRLDAVVKRARLFRWMKVGAVLALTGAAAWLFAGKASLPLFQRAWLVETPVPRKTQVVRFTGDRVLALGDDLRIEATAAGVIPAVGKLRITTASGKAQEFVFDPVPANPQTFLRTLQSVQESFTYTVQLGDNHSALGHVKVRPRPSIVKVDAEQIWPAYTALPPRPRAMSDLKLLAGSKLNVRLRASSRLRSATLRFLDAERKNIVRDTLLKPVGSTMSEWEALSDVPTKDASALTFHLVDEDGIESKGSAIHRLEVIPDEPPTIRVLWPIRREELVTRGATLLVSFEAKDDYGVEKVRLHYGINWNPNTPHKTLDLDLEGDTPKAITRRFDWHLDRLPLAEGDVVEFWLEAVDGNTATGPGVGQLAEHYQARVVSEAEKRADLTSRLDDTLRGLNDVKEGQEELSKRLSEMIQIRPQ